MNRAQKAVLFNALLFPGWGQIYLKNYGKGLLIIAGMTVGILSILWGLLRQTVVILKTAPLAKGTFGLGAILQLAVKSFRGMNHSYFLLLCILLIILWLLSIIDAYAAGRKMQPPTTPSDPESVSPPA